MLSIIPQLAWKVVHFSSIKADFLIHSLKFYEMQANHRIWRIWVFKIKLDSHERENRTFMLLKIESENVYA